MAAMQRDAGRDARADHPGAEGMRLDALVERRTLWKRLLAAVPGAAVNVGLATLVHLLGMPLYLDSLGTMLVGLHLGLLPGLLTVVLTHTVLALTGQVRFAFAICSLLTLVTVRLFTRRRWLGDYPGYLWMGLAAGIANGLGGSVISYFLFEGVTEVHAIDRLVMSVHMAGRALVTSVFWAGLVTNVIDKSLSALAAAFLRTRLAHLMSRL